MATKEIENFQQSTTVEMGCGGTHALEQATSGQLANVAVVAVGNIRQGTACIEINSSICVRRQVT